MSKEQIAVKLEKLIDKQLTISNEMTGDEASELLKLFFKKYLEVAIPYVMGLLREQRKEDAKTFVDGEVRLFRHMFRGNVILNTALHDLEHPWQELSHNEQLVKEILAAEVIE